MSFSPHQPTTSLDNDDDDMSAEASGIAGADRLLIVAAAGLSISDTQPNNPYHNPEHFKQQYPAVAEYGYSTCYETMGIARDNRVPTGVKKAFTAAHFLNMRYRFPPTEGYSWLHSLAQSFAPEDTFTWTSNVDGCFTRAGFDPDRVYQTQGEMSRWQCADAKGCGHVWGCEKTLREVDAASRDGVLDDLSVAANLTVCPKCGGETRPNLRGGDWFQHSPYEATGRKLLAWLDECVALKLKVAVIEVGVGPNTPVVTSIPASAFASAVVAAGGSATYVRVNPDAPFRGQGQPGDGVDFTHCQHTWRSLAPLVEQALVLRNEQPHARTTPGWTAGGAHVNAQHARAWQQRYTDILVSLRTPR